MMNHQSSPPQVRCMLNIWGVMLFIRLSWVFGQAGWGEYRTQSQQKLIQSTSVPSVMVPLLDQDQDTLTHQSKIII